MGTRLAAPHIAFCVLVVAYAFLGSAIFYTLEAGEDAARRNVTVARARALLTSISGNSDLNRSEVAELLQTLELGFGRQGVRAPDLLRNGEPGTRWDLASSLLFTFTLITTIGYGEMTAVTAWGRAFCIGYGVLGIPMTMLAIANIGKFMEEGYLEIHKRVRAICTRRSRRRVGVSEGGNGEAGGLTVAGLSIIFVGYVVGGAFLLPYWEPRLLHPLDAGYFAFVTLTTTGMSLLVVVGIGFGDIVPDTGAYLVVTLLYITLGLAIATLAIDIAAGYLRRIHYFGKQIKSARTALVWFGAKVLTVGELVERLSREWDAIAHRGESLTEVDLDRVVADAIESRQHPSLLPLNPRSLRNGYGGLRGPLYQDYACRFIDDSTVTTPEVSLHQDLSSRIIYRLWPLPWSASRPRLVNDDSRSRISVSRQRSSNTNSN